MFRYSFSVSDNLNEIESLKDTILKIDSISINKELFPIIQQEFESKFFNEFPIMEDFHHDIIYEGMSIFTPYDKIKT